MGSQTFSSLALPNLNESLDVLKLFIDVVFVAFFSSQKEIISILEEGCNELPAQLASEVS